MAMAFSAMATAGGPYSILAGGLRKTKWIYYDDTVFSPDGQHYAYLGYDNGIKIYLDDVEIATMPKSAYVESLHFSDNSSVLVYRVSNSNSAFAVAAPGTQMIPKPSTDNQNLATLTITSNSPHALIFLDDQFIGTAPQTIRVSPGLKPIELHRRGYQKQKTELTVEPNSSKTTQLHLEPLPTRKAVESILEANPKMVASRLTSEELMKIRWLVRAPYDDDILGVLNLDPENTNAVLFGESGIYVHNKHSSLSDDPQGYFVPYTVFADSPEPKEHKFYEVALTENVVAKLETARCLFCNDDMRKFMTDLRKSLQAVR